jgi:hypothetical protein
VLFLILLRLLQGISFPMHMPLIKFFISYHTQAAAHIQSVFEISIIRHSSSPHTFQTPVTCVPVPTYFCKIERVTHSPNSYPISSQKGVHCLRATSRVLSNTIAAHTHIYIFTHQKQIKHCQLINPYHTGRCQLTTLTAIKALRPSVIRFHATVLRCRIRMNPKCSRG